VNVRQHSRIDQECFAGDLLEALDLLVVPRRVKGFGFVLGAELKLGAVAVEFNLISCSRRSGDGSLSAAPSPTAAGFLRCAIPNLRRYRKRTQAVADRVIARRNESNAERLVVISRATKGQRL
jgi:hypothetical protein